MDGRSKAWDRNEETLPLTDEEEVGGGKIVGVDQIDNVFYLHFLVCTCVPPDSLIATSDFIPCPA